MLYIEKENAKNACGPKIRRIREEKRLTQAQLASRVQVLGLELSDNCISKIELGQRALCDYELFIIADALNVPHETLIL